MNVATVGDNCMDVYVELDKAYPGGNPVNVAVYMKGLGIESAYVGVVGKDSYGKKMKNAIRDAGVNTQYIREMEGSTAKTKVQLKNGERILGDYDEGVLKKFKINDEELTFLLQQDLVHTGIWGKVENDLYKMYKKGPLISFDFADKLQSEIVKIALPYVDYAFFAYERDDEYIREFIISAQKLGAKVVVATLGENGSIAWDGEKFTSYGIIPVEVVDTMGAGDSYIAGFMRGVLMNKSIDECMAIGAKNASNIIQHRGAW